MVKIAFTWRSFVELWSGCRNAPSPVTYVFTALFGHCLNSVCMSIGGVHALAVSTYPQNNTLQFQLKSARVEGQRHLMRGFCGIHRRVETVASCPLMRRTWTGCHGKCTWTAGWNHLSFISSCSFAFGAHTKDTYFFMVHGWPPVAGLMGDKYFEYSKETNGKSLIENLKSNINESRSLCPQCPASRNRRPNGWGWWPHENDRVVSKYHEFVDPTFPFTLSSTKCNSNRHSIFESAVFLFSFFREPFRNVAGKTRKCQTRRCQMDKFRVCVCPLLRLIVISIWISWEIWKCMQKKIDFFCSNSVSSRCWPSFCGAENRYPRMPEMQCQYFPTRPNWSLAPCDAMEYISLFARGVYNGGSMLLHTSLPPLHFITYLSSFVGHIRTHVVFNTEVCLFVLNIYADSFGCAFHSSVGSLGVTQWLRWRLLEGSFWYMSTVSNQSIIWKQK